MSKLGLSKVYDVDLAAVAKLLAVVVDVLLLQNGDMIAECLSRR